MRRPGCSSAAAASATCTRRLRGARILMTHSPCHTSCARATSKCRRCPRRWMDWTVTTSSTLRSCTASHRRLGRIGHGQLAGHATRALGIVTQSSQLPLLARSPSFPCSCAGVLAYKKKGEYSLSVACTTVQHPKAAQVPQSARRGEKIAEPEFGHFGTILGQRVLRESNIDPPKSSVFPSLFLEMHLLQRGRGNVMDRF